MSELSVVGDQSGTWCRGDEEAGLYVREAAHWVLQHIYRAVPAADIKERVLASIGGNKVQIPGPITIGGLYVQACAYLHTGGP